MFNTYFSNQLRVKVHDLGSSVDPNVLYDTVMNIKKNINNKEKSVVYFALTGALSKQFELSGNRSNFSYTKQVFFPHISIESLSYYLTSVKNLLFYDKNKQPINSLVELHNIFSLALYKIT